MFLTTGEVLCPPSQVSARQWSAAPSGVGPRRACQLQQPPCERAARWHAFCRVNAPSDDGQQLLFGALPARD